ncbi:MAG TPA: DNA recombination protein RmuC [Candidatus Desulfofervidus auxilii]|uniref:DNA recombination protein RmuC n=1 Tax=Desulfofervidus auxilii TaxID=1621989 RepID=A0A7C0Y1J9_DESA2|nr:DNA recombination protein RmuC [Candidatus Desulfofervidus auxilii]
MLESIMFIEILLLIIIFLLAILIFLFFKKTKDVESAVSNAWIKLGLDEKVGILATYAKDIRESYKSFEQLLRVPTERASFGELSLETILSDQLPQNMFGIRQKILDGKIPDANIKSTVGIICIDAKFPLDNYKKMLEVDEPKEKENFKKQFLKDVQGHLTKIAKDYVCPEKGSANFAFAYIPSESVYWFLVNEAFEILRDYAKKGVQVVSPLTFSHKIELIKAGVHAKRLSEEAEKIKNELIKLSKMFKEIDEKWRVFYQTHLRNLGNKAEELDKVYKRLKEEFERIERFK